MLFSTEVSVLLLSTQFVFKFCLHKRKSYARLDFCLVTLRKRCKLWMNEYTKNSFLRCIHSVPFFFHHNADERILLWEHCTLTLPIQSKEKRAAAIWKTLEIKWKWANIATKYETTKPRKEKALLLPVCCCCLSLT